MLRRQEKRKASNIYSREEDILHVNERGACYLRVGDSREEIFILCAEGVDVLLSLEVREAEVNRWMLFLLRRIRVSPSLEVVQHIVETEQEEVVKVLSEPHLSIRVRGFLLRGGGEMKSDQSAAGSVLLHLLRSACQQAPSSSSSVSSSCSYQALVSQPMMVELIDRYKLTEVKYVCLFVILL